MRVILPVVAAAILSGPALADDCSYVSEGYDWGGNVPYRNVVDVLPKGDERGQYRWLMNGREYFVESYSLGTGVSARSGEVVGESSIEPFIISVIDLSHIAKNGAPDEILMFAGEPYFHVCGEQKNYVWTTDVPEDFPKPVGGQ